MGVDNVAMGECQQLASAVAHRLFVCHYGIDGGEDSRLYTDLVEMVRAEIQGEALLGDPDEPESTGSLHRNSAARLA